MFFLEINFSRFGRKRLHDNTAHMCSSGLTQADWEKAGFTKFEKVRLTFMSTGLHSSVLIDRTDTTYTKHKLLGGSGEPKDFGTAGDCYSWNECPEARKGSFSINLGTQVDIDWARTGDWEANAWGNGNFIVDFERGSSSASARCGGWCGDCKPSKEIFLAPAGKFVQYRLNGDLFK